MPDPHRIKRELGEFLSRPHYSNLFSRRNQFSNKSAATPASLAAETADWIMRNNPLVDPVEVLELAGRGLQSYRAYDLSIRRQPRRCKPLEPVKKWLDIGENQGLFSVAPICHSLLNVGSFPDSNHATEILVDAQQIALLNCTPDLAHLPPPVVGFFA